MTGTTTIDTGALIEQLDVALGALLAARVVASQSAPEAVMPEEALDLALRGHEGYQRARRAFSEALAAVGAVVAEPDRSRVLVLEAKVNALLAQVCEASWALAWTAAARGRQP